MLPSYPRQGRGGGRGGSSLSRLARSLNDSSGSSDRRSTARPIGSSGSSLGRLTTSLNDSSGSSLGRLTTSLNDSSGSSRGRSSARPFGSSGSSRGRSSTRPIGSRGSSRGRLTTYPNDSGVSSRGRQTTNPNGSGNSSRSGSPGRKECLMCGNRGHVARNCPAAQSTEIELKLRQLQFSIPESAPFHPPFLAKLEDVGIDADEKDIIKLFPSDQVKSIRIVEEDAKPFRLSLFYPRLNKTKSAFVEFTKRVHLINALKLKKVSFNDKDVTIKVATIAQLTDSKENGDKREEEEEEEEEEPLSDEERFNFSFLTDTSSVDYLTNHGRVLLVVRGPPNTGKEALCNLICSAYPSAVTLSSSEFYKEPFFAHLKVDCSQDKLSKPAHAWCLKKLKELMEEDTPFIVLKNTLISAWQIDAYLQKVSSLGYTIIMAETPRKLKGKERDIPLMDKWSAYVPWYTGWFLNPVDASFLLDKERVLFNCLLDLATLREDWKMDSDVKEFEDYYIPINCPFAICYDCKKGFVGGGYHHYTNQRVTDNLGKVFPLNVVAFLVEEDYLTAVVQLNDAQKELYTFEEPVEEQPEMAEHKGHQLDYSRASNHVGCAKVAPDSRSTFAEGGANTFKTAWKNEDLDFDAYSMMVLAAAKRRKVKFPFGIVPRKYLKGFLEQARMEPPKFLSSHGTNIKKFDTYKTQNGSYILFPDCDLYFKSVYTGSY